MQTAAGSSAVSTFPCELGEMSWAVPTTSASAGQTVGCVDGGKGGGGLDATPHPSVTATSSTTANFSISAENYQQLLAVERLRVKERNQVIRDLCSQLAVKESVVDTLNARVSLLESQLSTAYGESAAMKVEAERLAHQYDAEMKTFHEENSVARAQAALATQQQTVVADASASALRLLMIDFERLRLEREEESIRSSLEVMCLREALEAASTSQVGWAGQMSAKVSTLQSALDSLRGRMEAEEAARYVASASAAAAATGLGSISVSHHGDVAAELTAAAADAMPVIAVTAATVPVQQEQRTTAAMGGGGGRFTRPTLPPHRTLRSHTFSAVGHSVLREEDGDDYHQHANGSNMRNAPGGRRNCDDNNNSSTFNNNNNGNNRVLWGSCAAGCEGEGEVSTAAVGCCSNNNNNNNNTHTNGSFLGAGGNGAHLHPKSSVAGGGGGGGGGRSPFRNSYSSLSLRPMSSAAGGGGGLTTRDPSVGDLTTAGSESTAGGGGATGGVGGIGTPTGYGGGGRKSSNSMAMMRIANTYHIPTHSISSSAAAGAGNGGGGGGGGVSSSSFALSSPFVTHSYQGGNVIGNGSITIRRPEEEEEEDDEDGAHHEEKSNQQQRQHHHHHANNHNIFSDSINQNYNNSNNNNNVSGLSSPRRTLRNARPRTYSAPPLLASRESGRSAQSPGRTLVVVGGGAGAEDALFIDADADYPTTPREGGFGGPYPSYSTGQQQQQQPNRHQQPRPTNWSFIPKARPRDTEQQNNHLNKDHNRHHQHHHYQQQYPQQQQQQQYNNNSSLFTNPHTNANYNNPPSSYQLSFSTTSVIDHGGSNFGGAQFASADTAAAAVSTVPTTAGNPSSLLPAIVAATPTTATTTSSTGGPTFPPLSAPFATQQQQQQQQPYQQSPMGTASLDLQAKRFELFFMERFNFETYREGCARQLILEEEASEWASSILREGWCQLIILPQLYEEAVVDFTGREEELRRSIAVMEEALAEKDRFAEAREGFWLSQCEALKMAADEDERAQNVVFEERLAAQRRALEALSEQEQTVLREEITALQAELHKSVATLAEVSTANERALALAQGDYNGGLAAVYRDHSAELEAMRVAHAEGIAAVVEREGLRLAVAEKEFEAAMIKAQREEGGRRLLASILLDEAQQRRQIEMSHIDYFIEFALHSAAQTASDGITTSFSSSSSFLPHLFGTGPFFSFLDLERKRVAEQTYASVEGLLEQMEGVMIAREEEAERDREQARRMVEDANAAAAAAAVNAVNSCAPSQRVGRNSDADNSDDCPSPASDSADDADGVAGPDGGAHSSSATMRISQQTFFVFEDLIREQRRLRDTLPFLSALMAASSGTSE